MNEQGKLGTLKKLSEDAKINYPDQAPDAIEEYLDNIESKEAELVKAKFKEDPKYFETFKDAIAHTSLMVFIGVLKATQQSTSFDFDQYVREFLFYSRSDDLYIYNMRTFYLTNLDASEMNLNELVTIEAEKQNLTASPEEISKAESEYNSLIQNLVEQYKETKIHLTHE